MEFLFVAAVGFTALMGVIYLQTKYTDVPDSYDKIASVKNVFTSKNRLITIPLFVAGICAVGLIAYGWDAYFKTNCGQKGGTVSDGVYRSHICTLPDGSSYSD